MPGFTLPVNVPVTIRTGNKIETVIPTESVTVLWDESKKERQKAKNMMLNIPYVSDDGCMQSVVINTIGTCVPTAPQEQKQVPNNPQPIAWVAKEKKMSFDLYDDECDCCSETQVTKQAFSPEKVYLLKRTDEVRRSKLSKVYQTYNLEPVAGPLTLNELVQRIKDGKFTIKNNAGDKQSNYNGGFMLAYDSNFSWGTVAPDESGAQKARDAIEVAATKSRDAIVAGDSAAGLAAIQAFDSQTF